MHHKIRNRGFDIELYYVTLRVLMMMILKRRMILPTFTEEQYHGLPTDTSHSGDPEERKGTDYPRKGKGRVDQKRKKGKGESI